MAIYNSLTETRVVVMRVVTVPTLPSYNDNLRYQHWLQKFSVSAFKKSCWKEMFYSHTNCICLFYVQVAIEVSIALDNGFVSNKLHVIT